MQRHEFDVLSFVAGLLATGGAVLYQLDVARVVQFDARWAVSLALVLTGLTGVATALRSPDARR